MSGSSKLTDVGTSPGASTGVADVMGLAEAVLLETGGAPVDAAGGGARVVVVASVSSPTSISHTRGSTDPS